MHAGILGISFYLPQRRETNEDLRRENPDWRMDELYEKSGISARHVAGDDETASDLGYNAAARLLHRSVVPPEEIDYLIYCTQSPDHFLPSAACVLQKRLGLGTHVGAFDYNLGCSGFIYGLQIAKSMVTSGVTRNVLLITADTYSKFIHARDRTVRTLFGDGAAATLIGRSDGPGRIGDFVVGTDGTGADKMIVPAGGLRMPSSPETADEITDDADCTRSKDNLFMDGPAIFSFVITTVPRTLKALLQKTGLSSDDVDWYVYHQANKYMLEHLARRSKIPDDKMIIDVETTGNTVSASIPIAIQRSVEAGKIRVGHRLVLVGFGVGYSWGACDVVWE
ncbi:MAG: ketoacyl-ACP synthase III [Candidatus Nealsonbacteria bacterium]|nr:ketoacyl-ACP synthase III [Candidatus Nealsonbacteria bacterium]